MGDNEDARRAEDTDASRERELRDVQAGLLRSYDREEAPAPRRDDVDVDEEALRHALRASWDEFVARCGRAEREEAALLEARAASLREHRAREDREGEVLRRALRASWDEFRAGCRQEDAEEAALLEEAKAASLGEHLEEVQEAAPVAAVQRAWREAEAAAVLLSREQAEVAAAVQALEEREVWKALRASLASPPPTEERWRSKEIRRAPPRELLSVPFDPFARGAADRGASPFESFARGAAADGAGPSQLFAPPF